MPAGRFRRYNRKPMRRKAAPKRKVDRKQNRQIAKIKRALYTKVYTIVNMPNINLGSPTSATPPGDYSDLVIPNAYIAPISPAMCQGQAVLNLTHDSLDNALPHKVIYNWANKAVIPQVKWTDTSVDPPTIEDPPVVSNQFLAGASIKTTYCKIRYRIQSSNAALHNVAVFVVRPKRKVADQIASQNHLKRQFKPLTGPDVGKYALANPGSQAGLQWDKDFCFSGAGAFLNPSDTTNWGISMNPQRWEVVHKHYHKLQDPEPVPVATQNNVSITDLDKNPREQYGSFSLSMNSYVRAVPPTDTSQATNWPGDQSNGFSMGYASCATLLNVKNEGSLYLVAFANSPSNVNQIKFSHTQQFTHQVYDTMAPPS